MELSQIDSINQSGTKGQKRHKKRRKVQLVITLFIVIFIITIPFWYMSAFVNPIIVDYSTAKIEGMTVKAVNRSINNVVRMDTYRNLVDIKYDSAGKITSLATNMLEMNGLASDIAVKTQYEIDRLASAGIDIPIGTFSGLPILTGVGRSISVRVVPVGSVNCSFASDFSAAGINQTRHRIILKVNSIVTLIIPLTTVRIKAEIEVMLCESIIIGEVPDWFFSR